MIGYFSFSPCPLLPLSIFTYSGKDEFSPPMNESEVQSQQQQFQVSSV